MRRYHAIVPVLAAATVISTACGGASMKTANFAAPVAATPASQAVGGNGAPTLAEQLVVEAWVTVEVDDVQQAANTIRERIEAVGGRVTNENLSGGATSWTGSVKMRIPPKEVSGFVGWIEQLGDVQSKRVEGTDVSRTLFDQAIALENYRHTLDRLRQLLTKDGLEMKDILAIENEMTRLRGEIERIEGEKRFLEDRVAWATIDVELSRRAGVVLGPEAKFYPGPRFAALTLLDPNGRQRTRLGAGLVLHTVAPGGTTKAGNRGNFELDVFEDADGNGASVLVTAGGAVYSDFLGRGRNRFLNPYLGMRLGYGYLDGSAFTFAATAGVELFKHKFVMVDLNVRGVGFVSDEFDTAIVSGGSIVFAF
jgi:hypothetical protein